MLGARDLRIRVRRRIAGVGPFGASGKSHQFSQVCAAASSWWSEVLGEEALEAFIEVGRGRPDLVAVNFVLVYL